jgi:hypothetical protein
MAKKLVTVEMSGCEADGVAVWGKVVNVYDSYANAIANGDTGLVPVFAVNPVTGSIASSATTQHGKNSTSAQAGLTINEMGKFLFAVDVSTAPIVYLNSALGGMGGVMKVIAEDTAR